MRLERSLADLLPWLGRRVQAGPAVPPPPRGQAAGGDPRRAAFHRTAGCTAHRSGRLRCLLDRFTITYAPGRAWLWRSARRRRNGEPRLVAVGIPCPTPGRSGSRPWSAGRRRPLPSGRGHTADGGGATLGELAVKLAEGTHLHFACHGLFPPDSPLDACLQLSEGDRLKARDVLSGAVALPRARLVVLSACRARWAISATYPMRGWGCRPACSTRVYPASWVPSGRWTTSPRRY